MSAGGANARHSTHSTHARSSSWQSLGRPAIAVPVLAALSLLWLLRQPDWTSFTTIYIDDAIFLNQATVDPVSILSPHNGYLHLLPRAIAALAAALPLTYAPIVFALACAVVVFGAMVIVWWVIRRADRPWSAYALPIAGTLALLPVASTETIATIACLQWQLIAASIVAIGLGRIDRSTTLPLAALLLMTALSSPLALVLIPGALWLAIAARRTPGTASSWSVALSPAIALALGLLAQLLVVMTTTVSDEAIDTAQVPLVSGTTAASFLEMSGPLALVGSPITRPIVSPGAVVIAIAFLACWAAVTIAVVIVARGLGANTGVGAGAGGDFTARIIALLAPGVAVIAISLVIRPAVRTLSMGNPGGTRYVVPLAYAMWVLAVLAVIVLVGRAQRPSTVLAAAAGVIAVGVIAVNWDYSLSRPDGPRWASTYAAACEQQAPGTVVPVSTSPPPWVTAVPCP